MQIRHWAGQYLTLEHLEPMWPLAPSISLLFLCLHIILVSFKMCLLKPKGDSKHFTFEVIFKAFYKMQ